MIYFFNIISKLVKWCIYSEILLKEAKKFTRCKIYTCFTILFIMDIILGCFTNFDLADIYFLYCVGEVVLISIALKKIFCLDIYQSVYCGFLCRGLNELGAIIISLCIVAVEFSSNKRIQNYYILIDVIRIILCYSYIELRRKNRHIKIYKYQSIIGYIITTVYIFMKNMSVYAENTDELDIVILRTIATFGTILLLIFLTLYLTNKYKLHQEKLAIQAENKQLAARLHKSKEVMPALVSLLVDITENRKITDADTRVLLKEVQRLYQDQMQETEQDDMLLKNFCSTGLQILDRQLLLFLQEAVDKGINFDIFVSRPIDEDIEKLGISQLHLQRLIGDMIRNAFRAIERSTAPITGEVLLVLGCKREGVLEVVVYDNGADFPVKVLNSFGSVGITTGGTGYGLADLVGYVDKMEASVRLEEFEAGNHSFAKSLAIIFDHKNVYQIHTPRRCEIADLRWEN
ncbi:MAG: hypothetical protein R3Y24_08180 [Eubacteriales bacterium]